MDYACGIDYSITGPAVCVHPLNKPWSLDNCRLMTMNSVKKNQGVFTSADVHNPSCAITVLPTIKEYSCDIERYEIMSDKFFDYMRQYNIYELTMEGYAYAAAGKVFNLAEATGILKYRLYKEGIKYSIETPPVFKKYATGKGNANKDKMYDAFHKDTGYNLIGVFNYAKVRDPIDNLVDAYWICKHDYERRNNLL